MLVDVEKTILLYLNGIEKTIFYIKYIKKLKYYNTIMQIRIILGEVNV